MNGGTSIFLGLPPSITDLGTTTTRAPLVGDGVVTQDISLAAAKETYNKNPKEEANGFCNSRQA